MHEAGFALYRVDAFAPRPFAGNPAAVCVVEPRGALDDATCQAIAAENNLSETAFITRRADGDYDIRWFTPTTEVPLCGHATLASAHVVLRELEPERPRVTFVSADSGPLAVERAGARLRMSLPADPPAACPTPAGLIEALGATPSELVRGAYYLARFDTPAQVAGLRPDFRALATIGPGELIATAAVPADDPDGYGSEGPLDFVSRFFGPSVGVDEDPVTGSAHCILAPYWAERLAKSRLRARQISARGGDLECIVEGDRVILLGTCALFARARIYP